MPIRITFQGKKLLFVGFREERDGAICSDEQYRNGQTSYAHLFPDGRILRHRVKIGTYEDIEWGERVKITPTGEAMIRATCMDFQGDGTIPDAN